METIVLNNSATCGDEAENLILRKLFECYLAAATDDNIWSMHDTCVTARRIGNRTGVPADATTWQYRLENPELAWTVDVRAVWRCGRLMRPWSTHIAVTHVWDDEDRYGSPAATRDAFRAWLRALPL